MTWTGAATYVPYSAALAQKFTFTSRYEETVPVYQVSSDGKEMALPRGAVPLGALDQRDDGIPVAFLSHFKPQKPEQPRLIEQAVQLLQADEQFVIAAPAGFGKTFCSVEIAGRMQRRFCVIVTKEDVMYQWQKAIQLTLGLPLEAIGLWRADQGPSPSHQAVIALVQSVSKGPERYGAAAFQGFGLVICDEVHRMAAQSFSQCMWHFPARYRLGLSATPNRKDGKEPVFFWHIGPVKVKATLEVLVPKVLLQATGWTVPRDRDGEQLAHDFGRLGAILKPLTHSLPRNQLIVEILTATVRAGRSTLAFSDSLEHLRMVADLLIQAGVDESLIGFYVGLPSDFYGTQRKAEQRAVREQHALRPVVLATYAMASEATDLPWLDTCVLMTPKADVIQIVGRIRREYDDKKRPVVIDLQDVDSPVLAAYGKARCRWYQSLGAELVTC